MKGNKIVIFCGVIAMILAKFNINIGSEDLQMTAGLIIALIGNVVQYVHRYKKGDVTLGGAYK